MDKSADDLVRRKKKMSNIVFVFFSIFNKLFNKRVSTNKQFEVNAKVQLTLLIRIPRGKSFGSNYREVRITERSFDYWKVNYKSFLSF